MPGNGATRPRDFGHVFSSKLPKVAACDKGLAALKSRTNATLGIAVGVASRNPRRLRRIAQGAFGLAGRLIPVRQPARSVTHR